MAKENGVSVPLDTPTTSTSVSMTVGIPEKTKHPSMSQREHLMSVAGFSLTGFMTLLPFQFAVVMLPVLTNHFLDGRNVGNSLLGTYQIFCVLALLVILKVGALHWWLIQGGLALSAFSMAAFSPAFFYGSLQCRLVWTHILMGLLGACNAMLQSAGFARAAILPRNYVGTTSIGQAVPGLMSFIVTGILMNFVYDMSNKDDVVVFAFVCCAIVVVASMLVMGYMHVFLRAPFVVESVNAATQSARERKVHGDHGVELEANCFKKASDSQDLSALPPRPWKVMLRGSAWELSCVFIVFFVTFNLFPKVGPIGFNFEGKCPAKMVLLFGMQFIGDFLGRSCLKLPHLHSVFGFLSLSRKGTIVASYSRILFYVPFFLAMKLQDVAFFNSFAWLMIIQLLLAFTLGWVGTCSLIHASLSVQRMAEKDRIGSLSTLMLATAICVGLLLAIAF